MHVILIHGQGRTPLSMSILGWRLRRQQYKTVSFGYAVSTETFEGITNRFIRTIQDKISDRPYAIVAHSLGGIITRASLPHLTDNPPQHFVMLAPPNQPALVAKKLRSNPLYGLMTKDCGRKLGDDDFYQTLPLPTVPTTIIAGTKGLQSKLSPFGDETNDTILSVKETELEGYETILVPATHSFIMNSKQVAKIVSEAVSLN